MGPLFHNALEAARLVRAKGFVPDIVVDAGVATGTPWLYQTFPECFYHLFEPVKDFYPIIRKHLGSLRGRLHEFALGEENATMTISVVDEARKGGSSLVYQYGPGQWRQETPVRRLDDVLVAGDLGKMNLLKTDCQGFDLAVLRGAGRLLERFQLVIAEVPLKSRLFDFSDLVCFMKSNNFEVVDIVDPIYRPSDKLLGQVDLFFAGRDSIIFEGSGW